MLSPSDEEMISEAEKLMTGAKEFVRKMTIVSTKDSDDKEENSMDDKQAKVSDNCSYFQYILQKWAKVRGPKFID